MRESWLWPDAEFNARQSAYLAGVFASDDAREGERAFVEKRAPNRQGH